jgi:phage terminase large subunit-like protein
VKQPWKGYAAGSNIAHFEGFCQEHLRQWVDEWAGQPLALEPWQTRCFGEALAFGEDGWPVWDSVAFVVPRKNGKTSLLAAYAVYSLVSFDGSPEILLTASSDKQANRLFEACATFVRQDPTGELQDVCRIRDYLGEIYREDGGGKVLRMSSDPGRLHGYNPSLVICDELAQWTTPQLRRAFAALTTGGGARKAPQVFTITTAGEASTRASSILGQILDAAGEASDREDGPGLHVARIPEAKMLVYNYEAPTLDPFDVKAMKLANPASWITPEYLRRQAENPELTDAQVLQLHGCVWAAEESTFVAPQVLLEALDQTRRLEDGERIVLGFDGSEKRDETWLVACTLDGFAEPLGRWAKPRGAPDEWRIPRKEVHAAIELAYDRFDVVELAFDPPGWYSEGDQWAEEHDNVLMFETKQGTKMAPACERTEAALNEGALKFGGPLAGKLIEHFGNCVRTETPYGTTVRKDHPDSPRKIDGAVATIIGFDRATWHVNEVPTRVFAASV